MQLIGFQNVEGLMCWWYLVIADCINGYSDTVLGQDLLGRNVKRDCPAWIQWDNLERYWWGQKRLSCKLRWNDFTRYWWEKTRLWWQLQWNNFERYWRTLKTTFQTWGQPLGWCPCKGWWRRDLEFAFYRTINILFLYLKKNEPGPTAPPFFTRPRRNMIALSYSWRIETKDVEYYLNQCTYLDNLNHPDSDKKRKWEGADDHEERDKPDVR